MQQMRPQVETQKHTDVNETTKLQDVREAALQGAGFVSIIDTEEN